MPISIDNLDTEFREAVEVTLAACKVRDVLMVPYFGIRTPYDQARLWRQSRTKGQIDARIADLEGKGALFLAECIRSVGPQHGPHVTNAIPGYSWHQWKEALDCYWSHHDKAVWDLDLLGQDNGYRIYAEEATKAGLTAGGYWQSIKDWPHVQKRKAANPTSTGFSVQAINEKMAELFPKDEKAG